MTARITVIGIGNTLMGDDGVGVRVAERLQARELPEAVSVVIGSVAGMGLVGHVLASDRVIFVDAIEAGAKPGAVFRFDPDDVDVANLRSNTSHGLSVSYLVTAARLKGARPDVLIYAIQVGVVCPMPDVLTEAVEAAVAEVAEMIAADVGAIR